MSNPYDLALETPGLPELSQELLATWKAEESERLAANVVGLEDMVEMSRFYIEFERFEKGLRPDIPRMPPP